MPIEHINKTDTLNEGREKLNNAITAFNETVVEGDSSVEAAQARVDEKGVPHPTLKARIDDGMNSVNQQLAQTAKRSDIDALEETKANKEDLARLSDATPLFVDGVDEMNDNTKVYVNISDGYIYAFNSSNNNFESTGVLYQERGISNDSISFEKINFINYDSMKENLFNGKYYRTRWVDSTNGRITTTSAAETVVTITKINKNQLYDVETTGEHDRFVVGLCNSFKIGDSVELVYVDNSTQGNEFMQVYNENYEYLIIGLSATDQTPAITINVNNDVVNIDGYYEQKLRYSYNDNLWVDSTNGNITEPPLDTTLVVVEIGYEDELNIRTIGQHDRFTVALSKSFDRGEVADVIYANNSTNGNESYTLKSDGHSFLLIGVSASGQRPKINVARKVVGKRGIAPTSDNSYSGNYLKDESVSSSKLQEVSPSKLMILEESSREIGATRLMETGVDIRNGNYYLFDSQIKFNLYRITLSPNMYIKIKCDGSDNEEFKVLVTNEKVTKSMLQESDYRIDQVLNENDYINEFEFFNDLNGKELYVLLGSNSVEATISVSTSEFKSKLSLGSSGGHPEKTGIEKTKDIYPVMFGVKMSNERDVTKGLNETPRPVGWLYYIPEEPYEILYAHGSPKNMKHLCYWDKSVTWDGNRSPEWYRPFITREGDIIFVWRGDELGLMQDHPDSRQNPIIYPTGDWNNPIEIELTGTKPTAWLQNCGADYVYNQDVFLFSEYTRPHHKDSHVWRVTKPFTNPDNWKIVKSFELSGSNQTGMKHCHTMNYDTFSGNLYLTTGDDDTAARIYSSSDYGLTWDLELEGERRYARVLNFIFTKDKVFWANDDSLHGFYSVDRDEGGVPDFSNIETLFDLSGNPPTYVNALIDDPFGVLILNRFDGSAYSNPIKVYFWDIESSSMHVIKEISPLEGVDREYGFRVEAANFYQQKGDNKTIVGFGSPQNNLDLLNNNRGENIDKINNLVLKVVKKDTDEYDLLVSAISDNS